MASVSGALPNIFRWVFTVLAAICAFAALFVLGVMLIHPHVHLPPGPQSWHFDLDALGQPGSVDLYARGDSSSLLLTALRGNAKLFVDNPAGFLEVIERYGLPMALVEIIFLTLVFELMRRLFRNVGRGESFTQDTVRLVQTLAGVLVVFSFILSFVEGLFTHAVYAYVAQHASISISGSFIHLPAPGYVAFPSGRGFPFGSPVFFSGLLVLALSEVFRQGLALKRENELTI